MQLYVPAPASGNEHPYEDLNYESWLFSRYTIAVGAVGKLGRHASYSTAGTTYYGSTYYGRTMALLIMALLTMAPRLLLDRRRLVARLRAR